MYNPFSAFCDDFYVNMRLSTQLNLPHSRDTVLHFFERIQKDFPSLTRFRKHENGDLCLEENRESDSYRWVTLEQRRLLSGHVNPPSIEESLKIHQLLLELAPYNLGLSPVEVDYLDVLFGFDLSFRGNHDEVVAESLLPQFAAGVAAGRIRGEGGRYPAERDGRAERRLPAAGPHRRHHPHQQLSGPHGRLLQRRDQRLPDSPPLLGRPAEGADGTAASRRWPSGRSRCARRTSCRRCCGRCRRRSRRGA